MQAPEKLKVSLRGASTKEITRDALLEKTAKERAQRSQARKAFLAASLIQRVWRGRYTACKAADSLRADWDAFVAGDQILEQQALSVELLCKCILRPFLFFAGHHRFCLHQQKTSGDHKRFVRCFKVLLQSISCFDPAYNFCSLSIGSKEQQTRWSFQVRELLKLCGIALVESSNGSTPREGVPSLANLSVRLMVALTDVNLWKSISQEDRKVKATPALWSLLEWMVNGNANLYPAWRTFIFQCCPFPSNSSDQDLGKEKFVTIASAVTLALRPLQGLSSDCVRGNDGSVGHVCIQGQCGLARKAAESFCKSILTIPFVTNRLPSAILPALQHTSVFNPCLQAFGNVQTSANFLFQGVSASFSLSNQQTHCGTPSVDIPLSAWALANVVTLASGPSKKSSGGKAVLNQFVNGLDYFAYVKAVCALLEHMLPWIESLQQSKKRISEEMRMEGFDSCNIDFTDTEEVGQHFQRDIMLLVEQFGSLHQQWHLKQLLDKASTRCKSQDDIYDNVGTGLIESHPTESLALSDVAKLYAYLMVVFSALNPLGGALPVLNLLAFTQDLLTQLWDWLVDTLLLKKSICENPIHLETSDTENMQPRKVTQDEGFGQSLSTKWASAVSKMKGKNSPAQSSNGNKIALEEQVSQEQDALGAAWNIVSLRKGPGGIANEAVPVFILFCAAYGHLLLVLDDDEFYERQVPFTLVQQRIIAASLNTMIYNGFFSSSKHQFTSLMEAATKCLHSLYIKDCRRAFCPSSLWLAPAFLNRPPIAAAARAHEVAVASIRTGELSQASAMGYVLTTFPHVWPFEERVQIFREFVKSDKMCRKMAGEAIGPGPGSIEIAIRRGHIVEDGFGQLNPLGAKLKSGINVSFVNEHGLQEAGLDYGGLFKEFLTDLAKAAFDPGYGLFTQTATEEGLLFPHPAAASLGHGLQMIEFLGRIVGKALYEGILLDYTFSHVFIWTLLGRYSFLDELSTLDPELHRNLMYLKHYEGDARDLALDFTVTEEIFGKRIVVELRPGGAEILVTNGNKLQYVHAMADYKLNRQMKPLVNAFLKGLSDLIVPAWLNLFNAREFNQLLSGGEHDFDVDDLKVNTRYTGGYTESSRIIKLFWEVLKEFEPEERCALLKFVTSCSRAPLLGFKYLQPEFTIHKVVCDTPVWAMLGGQDVERLPSASTCYNTLKLPSYRRIGTLRSKLRYAIRSNAGFELS